MSSPSEHAVSQTFARLHPDVQRWVGKQRWQSLRPVQEEAIPPILAGDRDVILSAATAAGKTEAAFLPLATRILQQAPQNPGFQVVVISPLKALINDQTERLEDLLGAVNIPVHKRHGDVTQGERKKSTAQPQGVLLITPESLEAMFIQRGHQIPATFAPLLAVVVDELHSFIGEERGMQLQSLMHRLELALRRRIPRIGLSATLGDMNLAVEALRPRGGYPHNIINPPSGGGTSLLLKLHGYETVLDEAVQEPLAEGQPPLLSLTDFLFETLRGDAHLVFPNARGLVERLADMLREKCTQQSVPNEFWPHHGSLSKEIREKTEQALKQKRPMTVICTSTLEMGIDIGQVNSVAQVGCPPSVASLRQRMGRSGRRGSPPILRLHVIEPQTDSHSPVGDRLRTHLFQSTAMVSLMLQRWIEPIEAQRPHLSTLVQQLLSLVAQWGEISVPEAFGTLCGHGPFHQVDEEVFKQFLRDLGSQKLIRMTSDRKLVLDQKGERLVNHYKFYAAFQTPTCFRLESKGKTLGELPVNYPIAVQQSIIFAGRRWVVHAIDVERLVIQLLPAHGGQPPLFGGDGFNVHDRVRKEMRSLYMGTILPPFLDEAAQRLFAQGRKTFGELGLHQAAIISSGKDLLVFPWRGDKIMLTLEQWLLKYEVKASMEWSILRVSDQVESAFRELLTRMANAGPPDPMELARAVVIKQVEKHHPFLSEELLTWEWGHGNVFAPEEAWRVVQGLADRSPIEAWLN